MPTESSINICDDQIEKKAIILNNVELTHFYRSVFKCVDKNNDGYINCVELKKFLDNQEYFDIPEDVIGCVCKKFDSNKDDKLDFEEFLDMVNHPEFNNTFHKVSNRILKFIVIPPRTLERPHLALRRTVTQTGAYEKQIKCHVNVLGMAIISLVQIIIFFYNNTNKTKDKHDCGPVGRVLVFNPCKKIQMFRYISYMFDHRDEMHLFGNVCIQMLIGIILEMVHGWRVILIYFYGGFGGCLASSVFRRDVPLRGASGGVYAFYTTHIAAVILNWRQMTHPAVHLIIFTIVVGINVIYEVIRTYGDGHSVSHLCHAGGAVVGLLLGVNILKNLEVKKFEIILWRVCCIILATLTTLFVLLDILLPLTNDEGIEFCKNVNETTC